MKDKIVAVLKVIKEKIRAALFALFSRLKDVFSPEEP